MAENNKTSTGKKVAFGGAMAAAVASILTAVYKDEGGYSNIKQDPGGETNYGVTKVVAMQNGWTGSMKAFPKQCDTEADVCADKIYYQNYIVKPGYAPIVEFNPPVAEELVNTAVNMGPLRASKFLQQSLNDVCVTWNKSAITADGQVGKGTIQYFYTCQIRMGSPTFCVLMLQRMDAYQLAEYDRLVKNNQKLKVFYKGWTTHRIGNVDRKKCTTVAALATVG